MSEHYFSSTPTGESRPRKVSFNVSGKDFELQADSGTFSSNRLDPGTAVLLRELEEVSGEVLDLGCGWGPIAISIAAIFPNTKVWALDVNQRSLQLVRENAKQLNLKNVSAVTADEIPSDLQFDQIWSNPPIRIGKDALHELLSSWLPRMRVGGRAMLVVQKQLGAESLQSWLAARFSDFEVRKHSQDKGYRIIELRKVN